MTSFSGASDLNFLDRYQHPLAGRYASREMQEIFSPRRRYGTWRKLWIALAESEAELGIDIPQEALVQMCDAVDDLDLDRAAEFEKRFRHDVMAHVHLFGEDAPAAKGIIHLGATSAYVGDNTDLILHRSALELVRTRLVRCVSELSEFARTHASIPTLGYTHFQPAQPTTVGKRATLWIQDLILDLDEMEHRLGSLRFRGVRGTTGTQASFLELFDGDHDKVDALDAAVGRRMDFAGSYPVSGQTYPRKVDFQVLSTLAGIATSVSKIGHDLRLLARKRANWIFGNALQTEPDARRANVCSQPARHRSLAGCSFHSCNSVARTKPRRFSEQTRISPGCISHPRWMPRSS